ncbi:hypothetical protein GCM10009593_31190 [Microlunatus antarcticus]|uniref:Uncharacterized protein n=1 Tax=Microlunatus antarcticus TaxID=53388 RepID=A0A7W5JTG3_9ACTN|nr:hypothetical protein [Microlunatus antarcticus]MBB3325412.1 hypothetical protein [Microlunatus antarcticus]
MAVTLRGPVGLAAAPILTAVANGGRTNDPDLLVAGAQRSAMLVAVGSVLATASVILALLALNATTSGVTSTTAVPWIIALLVCGALIGVCCVVQQRLWLRAWNVWRVDPSASVGERFSWVVHVVSYPVVVAGIFAGIAASHDVGFAGAVANWSTLALVPLIGAQVVGAVQHVRKDGPPGTIPTHVRRLAARIERSRHED